MSGIGLLCLWGQMWVKVGDYAPGAMITVEHTCDGSNIPPIVQWGGAPPQTQVYVLRMYDPDAPADTFIHWIAYNLKTTRITPQTVLTSQGYNDFGKIGYAGPCPPPRDAPHRYFVEVFALRKPVSVSGAVTWERLWAAMADKVIARTETFVVYKRQKH